MNKTQTTVSMRILKRLGCDLFRLIVGGSMVYMLWMSYVKPLIPDVVYRWNKGDPLPILISLILGVTVSFFAVAAFCVKEAPHD